MKNLILFATMITLTIMVPFTSGESPKKDPKIVAKLPEKEDVPQYLQEISVTIRAGTAHGSGVVTNIDGECFVFTCGHVVKHLRNTRVVEDSETGRPKTIVDWDDAEIIKEHVEDGRIVGQTRMQAFIIKYSDADHGDDLAILKVRKKNLFPNRVVFYLDGKLPTLGTELWHMGSFLGQGGSNSLSSGMVSQVGRVFEGNVYDQTNCTAFRGSSGGGVFLKDGRYHSMLVRGAGETFNLIVPMRRIQVWAKRTKTEWLFDPAVAAPKIDDEWIRNNKIEDDHHSKDKPSGKEKDKFNFMILEIPLEKHVRPFLTVELPFVGR